MAKKPTPLAGEATTANYGWTKPTVGQSVDQWGGYINADLDGIDSVVHGIDMRSGDAVVSDTPPASPTPGMLWYDSVGGQTYVWYSDANSSQWVIAVNSAASLLPASTTVFGGVKVDGTTIKAATDGTISTTVVPLGDNRIINGDMGRDQRNNGASGTAAGYTVDRWQYSSNLTGKGAWQRFVAGPSLIALGFGYSLGFTSSSAYVVATGEYARFLQIIEADMVSDFAWGSANAQPVTLSFTVNSSLTGSFGGSVTNAAGTRSYPFAYSIPIANTWTKIAITVPGDTTGTWVMSGNAGSLVVNFGLGAGATVSGAAGAWTGGSLASATGSVSVVSTNGATFFVTGVKLEIGSVATPFNRQSLAKSMADCQRYYQKIGGAISQDVQVQGYVSTAGMGVTNTIGIYPMRAAPTAVIVGAFSQTNVASVNLFGGSQTLVAQIIATAAGTMQWSSVGTTAYVTLNAEL